MAVDLNAPPPDTLVHYTTLTGLLGIVSDRKFRASNVSYLNDKRELTHALAESVQALNALAKKADENWKPALKSAASKIKDGAVPDTYVACFCKEDDLLSQWRGYAGAEQGVSIVFDRKKLQKCLQHTGATLQQVFYTKVSTRQKVIALLKPQLEELRSLEELIEHDAEDRASSAFEAISLLLPRFKHRSFREEAEWRFVVQRKKPADDDVQYRIRGHAILPYIDLESSAPLPIEKIVIGPGKDPDFTRKSVEHFLRSRGYDALVENSNVPYRA